MKALLAGLGFDAVIGLMLAPQKGSKTRADVGEYGGKVFNRSAPVIKLPAAASDDDHLGLLGLLNSAPACFWMKQVFHNKGRPGAEAAAADEGWEFRYEFDGTKLKRFPLPAARAWFLACWLA